MNHLAMGHSVHGVFPVVAVLGGVVAVVITLWVVFRNRVIGTITGTPYVIPRGSVAVTLAPSPLTDARVISLAAKSRSEVEPVTIGRQRLSKISPTRHRNPGTTSSPSSSSFSVRVLMSVELR